MKKFTLIIEKSGDSYLGRVLYDEDLIVDEAETLSELEILIKQTLYRFYQLKPEAILFNYKYDLSALFEKFSYLKISNVARMAGVNASLLRQYVTGEKQASAKQAKKIEIAIHEIAKELLAVKVHGKA